MNSSLPRVRRRFASGLFLLTIVAATSAHAQTRLKPQAPFPTAASVSASSTVGAGYIVGADDVLRVSVLRHPAFSVDEITVPTSGTVSLPVVGQIRVAGRSLESIDAEITRKMLVRLRKPDVTVSLVRARPRPIYVVGTVKAPGIYEFRDGWRVQQALAASGGVSGDTDVAAVIVNRRNQRILDAPLSTILRDPASTTNIRLQTGDTVRFYDRVVNVSISGAVTRPGPYVLPLGQGVVEALGAAGGATNVAAINRALIRRASGQTVYLDLVRATTGDQSFNLPLQNGDALVVPELRERVSVLGAVERPGFYPTEDGRPLLLADVLAKAGNLAGRPESVRITLARRHSDGRTVSYRVDPVKLLELRDFKQNVRVQDGDIISVSLLKKASVLIQGQVRTPGSFEINEGEGIPELIARAGGVTEDARLSQVAVTRRGAREPQVVNVVDAVLTGASRGPLLLVEGDLVVVPRSDVRYAVQAAVNNPGTFALPEDRSITINEAIARAGGTRGGAQTRKIALLRRNPTAGTPDGYERQILGLDEIKNGKLVSNMVVQNGDIIYVPEANTKPGVLSQILSGLGAISIFRKFVDERKPPRIVQFAAVFFRRRSIVP
jgi:protein involved in polysaccharide export with SLBB domain